MGSTGSKNGRLYDVLRFCRVFCLCVSVPWECYVHCGRYLSQMRMLEGKAKFFISVPKILMGDFMIR